MAITNPYTDANGVFLNKFGLTNAAELKAAEYEATTIRAYEILTGKIQLDVQGYGLERLCAIHKHLFQDVYEWAGKPRTVQSFKRLVDFPGQVSEFSHSKVIASEWQELEKETSSFVQAKSLSFEQKQVAITGIFIKANRIHAFPEGNGRTMQVFMKQLAHEQGMEIDYSKVNAAEWNYASAVSGRYGRLFEYQHLIPAEPNPWPIKKIFSEITSPIVFREVSEQEFVNRPARAIAFEKLSREEAIKKHPELAAAYTALDKGIECGKNVFHGNLEAQVSLGRVMKQHIQGRLDKGETKNFAYTDKEKAALKEHITGLQEKSRIQGEIQR